MEDYQKYVNNFIVYYYSCNLSDLEEQLDKINRIFNLYIKQKINTGNLLEINNIFQFINNLNNENDKYKLKTGNNISNLIKLICNNNFIINTNNILASNISELINNISDIKVKSNIYLNLIDIVNNNFIFINKNKLKSNKDKDYNNYNINNLYTNSNYDDLSKTLNLFVYNDILNYIINGLSLYKLWIGIDYYIKCCNILNHYNFIDNSLHIKLSNILYNYVNIDLYNNGKWITNFQIQKQKILLRNILINYKKHRCELTMFKHRYSHFIDQLTFNNNEFIFLIDGRNIFYSTNTGTNNIDINKIKNYDKHINVYNNSIIDNMITKKIIHKNYKYNKQQIYLIFSESHANIINKLQLKNIFVMYSPKGINDDIIQLYLWLTYLGCILISNDKHSNYISKINANQYFLGLLNDLKTKYQYTINI
jgi:hypothetical protein